jgi:hypothetical protein
MSDISAISKLIKDNVESLVLERVDDYSTRRFYQEGRDGYLGHGAGSITDVSTSEERAYAKVGIKSGIVGP